MIGILEALLPLVAATGVALLVGLVPTRAKSASSPGTGSARRANQRVVKRVVHALAASLAGAIVGAAIFGTSTAAIALGLACCTVPERLARRAAKARLDAALAAWPLVLEETRVRVSGSGQSLPVALFESGSTTALGPHLAAAATTWGLSTDFERSLTTLRRRVADSVTDSVVETLLVLYLAGAVNADERLAALIADRRDDLDARREADARRAGVEFSRRFVLLVPAAMAVLSLFFGSGRESFSTAAGQQLLIAAILATAGCWVWSGRLAQVPERPRVFR